MVTSGVIAALSVTYAQKRFRGFGEIVRKAPYASGLLILAIGLYLLASGWRLLPLSG
jgi:nickel/cobalt transporter (NicO) family protein